MNNGLILTGKERSVYYTLFTSPGQIKPYGLDPFLSGNPLAPVQTDDVAADYILVSHGHGDHLGDTIAIAKRTGATVIANYEIQNWLAGKAQL